MGTARRVYDADGFISQVVYPNNSYFGFPQGVVVSYNHDARGELAAVIDPVAGYWLFSYDAAGRLVRKTQPTGVESQISYTPEGFVDQIKVQDPSRNLLGSFDYGSYDALGNPGTITTNEGTTNVTYDARSFVKTVTYPGPVTESFDYDLVGNRTRHDRLDATSRVYDLDAADEVTDIRDGSTNAVLETFQYDGAGRRTQRAVSGGATSSYTYDALGHLKHFQRADASSSYDMDLFYDATGHRFLRSDSAGVALYFGEWVEYRNGQVVRLVHGGGPDGILGEVTKTSNEVGAFVEDAAGNLAHDVVYTGGAQAAFQTQRYEAFGTVRAGSLSTDRGFAGRPLEGQSGLLYLRARHYEPETGRFLTPDPLGLASDQPYAYAANNPFVYSDPTGLGPQAHASLNTSTANVGSIAASSGSPVYSGTLEPSPLLLADRTGGMSQAVGAALGANATAASGNQGVIRPGEVIPGLHQYRDPVEFAKSWKDTQFGHWWTEAMPEQKSWGWYPKYIPEGLWDVFVGVPGELNKGFGADPHMGLFVEGEGQVYNVIATKTFSSRSEVIQAIQDYATSYKGSWRWPFGTNCHTFQDDMYYSVGLKAVPVK